MAGQDILSRLAPAPGARKRRKRIGRGQGSGHGKTSTRGEKGALSRSGSSRRPWFEGGQMPLARRVPKRGFHSPFRVSFQVVNVDTLERLAAAGRFPGGVVNPEALAKAGAVSKADAPVKILGTGAMNTKLEVAAHAFSKAAMEKIQAAGGTVHTLSRTTND